jgi:twinkle protein
MSKDNGKFLGHSPHDDCGSSDGLALYEHEDGSVDGYCWVCEKYVNDQEKINTARLSNLFVRAPTQEEILTRLNNIFHNLSSRDLTDRGIRAEVVEYFGVKVSVDPANGQDIAEHYYPYISMANKSLTAYKVRKVKDKAFYSIGTMQNTMLFGQYQAETTGAKKLYITEGECDAMALYQALMDHQKGTKWESYRPAVVSIVRGASKEANATKVVNELGLHMAFLNRFDEIIFVFDQDTAGENSAKAASQLFPGKAKIAKLPMKDANEMLLAGRGNELAKAVLFSAQTHKPSGIVTPSQIKEMALKPIQKGLDWPWPTLNRMTYGIHTPSLIGLGAGVGVGKTTGWAQLTNHLLNLDRKVGIFFFEEIPKKTLRRQAGKQIGVDLSKPDNNVPNSRINDAIDLLDGKLFLFDAQEDSKWDTVKEHIRYLVLVEGVKDIIIDPLTAMTYHLKASEANDELNRIFGELAGMINTLDFNCFYSSHLNPPEGQRGHEEGAPVRLSQFTGSRAMIKWSHLIFAIERDTQADTEDERNSITFRVLKNREYSKTGTFPGYYDDDHQAILEPTYDKPDGVTY